MKFLKRKTQRERCFAPGAWVPIAEIPKHGKVRKWKHFERQP